VTKVISLGCRDGAHDVVSWTTDGALCTVERGPQISITFQCRPRFIWLGILYVFEVLHSVLYPKVHINRFIIYKKNYVQNLVAD